MRMAPFVITLVTAGVVGYFAGQFGHSADNQERPQETAYERVMRTGELRCGYFPWPPLFIKDANNGSYSGIFYDITEQLGKNLGLEIVWQEEASFATFLQDIANGRYDAECTGGWPTPERGKIAAYTDNLFYLKMVAVARIDDDRFDGNLARINAPDVTVVGSEGENSFMLKRARFNKAKELALPPLMASVDQVLLNVEVGKADISFTDSMSANHYIAENPDKLKIVPLAEPIKVIPQNFTLPGGDVRLRDMLNIAMEDLINNGDVARILAQYPRVHGTYFPVAGGYHPQEQR